ncbi:MAG: hypothetical protein ABSH52_02360 [Terriglobia bacterium]
MRLWTVGYNRASHPSLEEAAEVYYESKTIVRFAWWRSRLAGVVLLTLGVLGFALLFRYLVGFGLVFPIALFHTLGFTNARGELSKWTFFVLTIWVCLLIVLFCTSENKLLKRL